MGDALRVVNGAYADQVVRQQAYQAAHPDVTIIYIGPHWQAVITETGGKTVITRLGLQQLLDTLDLRDEPGRAGQFFSGKCPDTTARSMTGNSGQVAQGLVVVCDQ